MAIPKIFPIIEEALNPVIQKVPVTFTPSPQHAPSKTDIVTKVAGNVGLKRAFHMPNYLE